MQSPRLSIAMHHGTRRIIINNHTEYQNSHIKAIIKRMMDIYWRQHAGPIRVQITFQYRRKDDGFCGGHAWLNSGHIVLKLPKTPDRVHACRPGDTPAMNMARTLLHELAHCRGLQHGEMAPDSRYNVDAVRDLPLAKYADRPAPVRPDKLQSLERRLANWVRKEHRAANAIRKIRGQISRIQRKRAADQPPSFSA